MKKLFSVLLLTAITLLSGCSSHAELNELAIAEAIGIDRTDTGYTVTLQYFNTDTTGGTTAIDSSKPNAVNVSGKGETIESALEALSYSCGKQVMLGSAGLIIFGKDAAADIRDSLSFSVSHYSGNPRAFIAVSETTASDILNVKFSEGNASVEKLEGLLKNAERLGIGCPLTQHEVLEMLCSPTSSAVLPLLKTSESGSELTEEGSSVSVTGGAVCTDDALAGRLTPEEMAGLNLLINENVTCELPVILRGKNVRLMIYGTGTKITPSLSEGVLVFEVRISGDCKIVSSQLPAPYEEREALEDLAGRAVQHRVQSALSSSVNRYGADIAGLSYRVRSYSPSLWNEVSPRWREYLSSAVFIVSCDFRMERFGVSHG